MERERKGESERDRGERDIRRERESEGRRVLGRER